MFNPHSPQTANEDQTSGCQCDICRDERDIEAVTIAVLTLLAEDKTSGVRTLPDNSNAATGQPDAETTRQEPPETLRKSPWTDTCAGETCIRDSLYDS